MALIQKHGSNMCWIISTKPNNLTYTVCYRKITPQLLKNKYGVGKGDTIKYMRLLSVVILYSIVFLSCNVNKNTYKKLHKECNIKDSITSPCGLLSLLSDSISFNKYFVDTIDRERAKAKEDCFNNTIISLFKGTQMEPNWSCSFPLCSYNSFSLHKSIYKIDILRLMRFYKCADTTKLQAITTGIFSNQELKIIENQNKSFNPIDTLILYGK
jgi:hypothetical protein